MTPPNTAHVGAVERHDGYNGATVVLWLVRGEDGTIYAAHPGGFFTYADTLDGALRRSDVISYTCYGRTLAARTIKRHRFGYDPKLGVYTFPKERAS